MKCFSFLSFHQVLKHSFICNTFSACICFKSNVITQHIFIFLTQYTHESVYHAQRTSECVKVHTTQHICFESWKMWQWVICTNHMCENAGKINGSTFGMLLFTQKKLSWWNFLFGVFFWMVEKWNNLIHNLQTDRNNI